MAQSNLPIRVAHPCHQSAIFSLILISLSLLPCVNLLSTVKHISDIEAGQDPEYVRAKLSQNELLKWIDSLFIYTAGEHLCEMANLRGATAQIGKIDVCFCDVQCLLVGDCCVDFVDFRRVPIRNRDYTCSRLGTSRNFYYTRSVCSNKSSLDRLQRLCHSTSARDHLADFPVFVNGTLYRNEYCALCSMKRDEYNNSRYLWTTRIYWRSRSADSPLLNFTELQKAFALGKYDYDQETRRYNLYFDHHRYGFTVEAEEFERFQFGEEFNTVSCPAYQMVDSCPNRSDPMSAMCELYTAYVHTEELHKSPVIYRNAHCAICNGISRYDLEIGLPSPPRTLIRAIFDFVPLSPNEYRCPPGYISLFGKICKPILCDIGLVWNGRQCVTNYGIPGCLNITLKVEWVRFLSSRKVQLLKTGTVFDSYYNISDEDGQVAYVRACTKTPVTLSLMPTHEIIAEVFLVCSCVCLLLQITTYLILPSTRSSRPGKIIILLSTSILLSHLSFLIKDDVEPGVPLCKIVAILAHLFYISSFLWMLVMAIDSCRALAFDIFRTSARANLMYYYGLLVAVGSLIIVMAGVATDYFAPYSQIAPLYGIEVCWFGNLHGFKLFFALPVIIVIVLNLTLFVYTTAKIRYVQTTSGAQNREVQRLQLSARLAVIIGLTWVFAILFFLKDHLLGAFPSLANTEVVLYLFFSLGLAQGIFIFIAFTCKKRIFNELLSLVQKKPTKPRALKSDDSQTSASSTQNPAASTQTRVEDTEAP